MTGPLRETFEDRGLTRRDFLTKSVRRRLAALLGGGVTAAGTTVADGTESSGSEGTFSLEDLRPLRRDAVMAAIDRIRAQRRIG